MDTGGSGKPNVLRPTNWRSPSAKEFWQALADGKLLARRCGGCATQFFPPKPVCPSCLSEKLEWVEIAGRGTLHSWTAVHLAGPEFDTPFLLGLVDLEGGIGRLSAKIVDLEERRLEIGMPVRIGTLRTPGDLTMYCITGA